MVPVLELELTMAPPKLNAQSPTFQNYLDMCAAARRLSDEWITRRDSGRATRWMLEELAWYVTQRLKHPCYVVEVPTGHGHTALPMPMVDEGPEEGWREVVMRGQEDAPQPSKTMTYDHTKVTDVIALVAQQHLEASERLALEAIRREHGIEPRRRDLVADADIELTREEYTRRGGGD